MRIEDFFKRRGGWMGFAILLIMLFHSRLPIDFEPLRIFKLIGYGGVDIFIFASGIGCFYSLEKNPDAFSFLRRRASRLIPTWWTFLFVRQRISAQQGIDLPWSSMLGNLFCVQVFTEWHLAFNWYIGALPILYILAPHFHSLVKDLSPTKFFLAELGLLALSFPFFDHNYLIFMTRLPIFLAGFYVASKRDSILNRNDAIGLALATLIGSLALVACIEFFPSSVLFEYGLWWYPFLLITPGLCFGLSIVSERVPALDRIFSPLGSISFELYLVHVLLIEIIDRQTELGALRFEGIHWLGFFIASLLGSIILNIFVTKIFGRRTA